MKHMKRLLSVLLTMAVLCTCLIPAASAVDDITGHWAETYLREMTDAGFLVEHFAESDVSYAIPYSARIDVRRPGHQ